MMCPEGLVVKVVSAMYGRAQKDVVSCSRKLSAKFFDKIKKNNCIAKNSKKVLESFCDSKQTCSVAAKNSNFGDPCRGIQKYLEVSYKCIELEKCRKGHFKHGNKCVEIVSSPMFPPGASKYCEVRGGRLVTIENMRMNRALSKQMIKRGIPDAFIGLSDSVAEGCIKLSKRFLLFCSIIQDNLFGVMVIS